MCLVQNVTCSGAQAPGQAFTNVVLGSAIFLVFEMSLFEFMRVTFQGVSAAAPRYLQRLERPNTSRFMALALPGGCLGHADFSIISRSDSPASNYHELLTTW